MEVLINILKIKATGFPGRLDMECEKKTKVRSDPVVLV